jgi:hypothetical protein
MIKMKNLVERVKDCMNDFVKLTSSSIQKYEGQIMIVAGSVLVAHMSYQYVYKNYMKNTPVTVIEKFAGIILIAHGLYLYHKNKN